MSFLGSSNRNLNGLSFLSQFISKFSHHVKHQSQFLNSTTRPDTYTSSKITTKHDKETHQGSDCLPQADLKLTECEKEKLNRK